MRIPSFLEGRGNFLKHSKFFRKFFSLVFISMIFAFAASLSFAQESPPVVESSDFLDSCLACHSNPNMTKTFPSGETISLYVDRDQYMKSVHGQQGFTCNKCHQSIVGFPHPEIEAENYREFSLQLYPLCTSCHKNQIMEIQGNVHMVALEGGNDYAAVCTDCHGNHGIQRTDMPGGISPRTCQKCHSQIFDKYEKSVHGAALIGEGNKDVPSCTDCHGSHKIIGPSNSPFHLFSPQICAKCHTNPELMGKYGIRADTFDTYVADFHGTTVTLFQKVAPDQETNKPVCIDCHGVHDILPPTDPNSHVMKENLLETCRKCHPNASANFPDSWMKHYVPTPENNKLVFYVGWFYKLLIPMVIGGMAIFVTTDFARQMIDSRKGGGHRG